MGRKLNQTVEVVIVNSEAILAAQKRFTEIVYNMYVEYLLEHNLTELKDPKDRK